MTDSPPPRPAGEPDGPRADAHPLPQAAAWTTLTRRQRWSMVLRMLVRPALSVLLLFVLYYWLPLRGAEDLLTAVKLALGLAAGLLVLAWEVRQVTRATQPVLRAIEAAAVGLPLYWLLFAAAYYIMAGVAPELFSEPVTRTGALYFTVTVFATVGFGDITATEDLSRAVVTLQMVLNLALLAAGLRVLTLAVRVGRARSEEARD